MKCSCIYVDDYAQPEAFKITTPVARKHHQCTECKRVIVPGEQYTVESGIWAGHPSRHKTCSDCISVRNEFFCQGYMYNELWFQFREYLIDGDGQIPSECLQNITSTARDKVFLIMDVGSNKDIHIDEVIRRMFEITSEDKMIALAMAIKEG